MEEVFARVARTIYPDDAQAYKQLQDALNRRLFCFNSPTLMNAGKDLFQASACYVLRLEDSMDSIFRLVKDAAEIYRRGCGMGVDMSVLRPRGTPTSTGSIASGPVPFLKVFNAVGETVTSSYGARRAAALFQLDVDHPDILEFIHAKENGDLSQMNLSVRVSDTFMRAVIDDVSIRLKDGRGVPARVIWEDICESAHMTGDPGLVFGSTCDRLNPMPGLGERALQNPCGEVCLPVGSVGIACNLASIALPVVMRADKANPGFLERVVAIAVRAMDKIVDRAFYPVRGMYRDVLYGRPLGLGVTGLADWFYDEGIRYGSAESVEMVARLMRRINIAAIKESILLAGKYGPCPGWRNIKNQIQWRILFQRYLDANEEGNKLYDLLERYGMRNLAHTSVAPTGTISWVLDCEGSAGIEPCYGIVWDKIIQSGDRIRIVNRVWQKRYPEVAANKDLCDAICRNRGSLEGLTLPGVSEKERHIFKVVHDLAPDDHLAVLAAVNRNVDQAVSKTVNLTAEASVEDVMNVFINAWRSECRSITVYRDGSLKGQPQQTGERRGCRRCPDGIQCAISPSRG